MRHLVRYFLIILFACAFAQAQQQPATPQMARPIEINTAEMRFARIEARLKRLETENAELKAQLDKFNEVSRRVITMPQGCTAGFANGATVGGVKEAFGSKLFPYLTCRAGQ